MTLRADMVTFGYAADRPVLRGVSAEFAEGTLTAILGSNGAGKSTLLRILLGLLTPITGRVTLDNREIASIPRQQLASRVAYVPQRPEMAFPFSVERVVAMGQYAHRHGSTPAGVKRALERMEISERAHDEFLTLSAGQQQRVALARALAQLDAPVSSPRVLLADEPVSAMDPKHALHAMRVLRDLRSSHTAVVVVLHDLTLASRFCDRAVLMSEEGCVIASGPTSDVLTPRPLREAFSLDFVSIADPASPSNLWLALPDRMEHASLAATTPAERQVLDLRDRDRDQRDRKDPQSP